MGKNAKIVVSCSRRTDIPACYSQWLINRIRDGYCLVPNPFNSLQVSKVPLNKNDTSVIVFWTKNAAPLSPYLDEINDKGLNYYFQFTLNNYPKEIEPGIPSLEERIKTFKDLSDKIGKAKVIWRYDPIIISNKTDAHFHIESFKYICDRLKDSTERCVLSIVDIYQKTERRMKELEKFGINAQLTPMSEVQLDEVIPSIVKYAEEAEIDVFSCAEGSFLKAYGIKPGKCIDDALINKLFKIDFDWSISPSSLRIKSILDWKGLLLKLQKPENDAEKGIQELLEFKSKRTIECRNPDSDINQETKKIIIKELKRLIDKEKLYEEKAFLKVTGEVKELINRGVTNLSENRTKLLNRLILESVFPYEIAKMQKDTNQRELCGCISSKDIGINDTCGNGCVYCYSTSSSEAAKKNSEEHNPDSPMLIGKPHRNANIKDLAKENEKITQTENTKEKSSFEESIAEQLDLFSVP